jgi:hypothetical protein
MFPARAASPSSDQTVVPLKLSMLSNEVPVSENAEAKTNSLQNNSGFFLWRFLKFYWNLPSQPPASLTPRTIVEQMRCTPRSYSNEMNEIYQKYTDSRVFKTYLTKALDTIPLNVLQTSIYFWGHKNFSFICKFLATRPAQFRQLLKLTPLEKYNYYPGQCTTESQMEILLEDALEDKKKLQETTDVIIVMIGEPRNGFELDNLYYFYLNKLINRQESDAYVAERIQICKNELAMEQIEALRKIENAPLIAKALKEIEALLTPEAVQKTQVHQKVLDENLSGS